MFVRNALFMLVTVVTLAPGAAAQNRRAQGRPSPAAGPGKTLCVDVVSFRQGKPAKGLIISSQGDHVLMAAERETFSRDNPELYERAAEAERDHAEKAWSQLRERLRQRLDAEKPDGVQESIAMRSLLERELARAEEELEELAAQPGQPLGTRFLWLELSSREIQGVKRASPEAQRVAVWAWSEGLSGVTVRDMADLQRELADEKINVQLQPPDLSHLLAPRQQSEDEWAARLAIMHYTLDTPLDFQGSNGVFVQTGDAAQPMDFAPLIQKMMTGNLDALLADLDPTRKSSAAGQTGDGKTDDWTKVITPQAEELKRSEFRATRVDLDPSGQAATVETAFVAKLPAAGWRVVWSARHTTQASEVSPEAEQQIAEDPQVKTALGLLSALGAGAEAEVKKAIRFGAATSAAQKAAQSQFFRFRDRFTQRLDGPPL